MIGSRIFTVVAYSESWINFFVKDFLLRNLNGTPNFLNFKRLDPMQALQDYSISLLIEDGYENLKSYLHRGILYTDLERLILLLKNKLSF